MRIVVIGASGRTGKYVVNELKNHTIIPFDGDILDKQNVNQQIRDCDAVVSVLGHIKGSPNRVQTDGIRNVVEVMKDAQISRIISLTGTGVRLPDDKITLIDRILNIAISIIDPERVKDGIAHTKVLQTSGLDWTVVRVLKLTNGTASESWLLTEHGPVKTLISRANVARAIAECIEKESFIRQAPIISRR